MFGLPRHGPPAWLVIFLGNPGAQYEASRHNVGWMVCDALAEHLRIPVQKLRFHALTGTTKIGGVPVLLLKPVTYMNLSGRTAGEAARFYKLPPERVLVVSDETALPAGKLRLRAGGSAGGHNGLKSIIEHLGSDRFPRLRVGVGSKPHPDYDMADWVLSSFSSAEKSVIAEAAGQAAEAIECVITRGMDEAMARYN